MEMRKVEVTYPHFAVGERVMRKNRVGIIGTVVDMRPPSADCGGEVHVQWDVQSTVFVHRLNEIEPLPEPPITDAERMAAIVACEAQFGLYKRAGYYSVLVDSHVFNADTAEQAIDAFVQWKRRAAK